MDLLLKRWILFRELDPLLTSACKFAKAFHYPKVGFLVLQNDDVYAVAGRTEDFKWLGNGVNYKEAVVNQASKVESLCGKGVIDYYGNSHSFAALKEDGRVYFWMCGGSSSGATRGIPTMISFSDDYRVQISQVSCGAQDTVYLTSEGEVFVCSSKNEGQLGSRSQFGLRRVLTKISGFDELIVQVEAGAENFHALDALGTVWSWGTHTNSSLGYCTSNYRQEVPRKIITLPKIKKIAVGNSHALALSETGGVYFWGKFNGKLDFVLVPQRIIFSEDPDPITDIASEVNARATERSSMEEVVASADPPIMTQPIKIQRSRVSNVWKGAFNDPNIADVRFSVENQELHALSYFLKIRSPYFRSMFANDWKESNLDSSKPIKICEFSFHIFRAFLFFLYNESLIDPEMDMDDLIELMRAADFYEDGVLLLVCEKKLKTKLTPENSCFMWNRAGLYNAKNLQNYALEFMAREYKQVANSEEWAQMNTSLRAVLQTDIDGIQAKMPKIARRA